MDRKFLVFMVLALFAFPSVSAGNEALIAGAKKEGQVIWYTTTSPLDNQPILDAFMKKYPFIRAQAIRAGGPEIAAKFMFEERAGKHIADIIRALDFDVERFKKERMMARYVSPSVETYPPGMKDPEGYWATDDFTFKMMAYNKTLVDEKQLPKSWFDLLDPKWQGKMAFEVQDYRLYAGWEQRLGIERARKLIEGLAKQKVILRKGADQIAQLLAAGEFPMAQVYVHHLERVKSKGAPVDWIKTLDPLVALRGAVGVSARAPHPNAARLFLDFYLSKEGEQLVRMWGKIPAHPDVDHLYPVTKSKELKIHFLDATLTSQNFKHYSEMAKIALSQ